MAITEVGKHQTNNWSQAISDTHGLTIVSGDVAVCLIRIISTDAVTDNNGANAFTGGLVDQDGCSTLNHYSIFYRVAGASEPSAYAFAVANANTNWVIQTRVFRGVDTTSPWDIISSNYASAYVTGTTRAAASITTNYPGSMAIAYFCSNVNTLTWSSVDNGFAEGQVLNNAWGSFASYTKTITSAGAVGTTTATFTPSMTDWTGGGIIALRQYVPAFTGLTVTRTLQG